MNGLVRSAILARLSKMESITPQMSEENLRAELHAVYHSWSWRITAPLRYMSLTLRRVKFVLTSPKRAALRLLQICARNPRVVQIGKRFLHQFPQLKSRVKGLVGTVHQMPIEGRLHSADSASLSHEELTPKAQALYALFQSNIKTKK